MIPESGTRSELMGAICAARLIPLVGEVYVQMEALEDSREALQVVQVDQRAKPIFSFVYCNTFHYWPESQAFVQEKRRQAYNFCDWRIMIEGGVVSYYGCALPTLANIMLIR